MTKPSDILASAKTLITDPAVWTQGCIARDVNGVQVDDVFSADACQFCSYGAIIKAAGPDLYAAYFGHPAVNQLDDRHTFVVTLGILVSAFNSNIGKFNDAQSHKEVLGRFDRAITAAIRREAEVG